MEVMRKALQKRKVEAYIAEHDLKLGKPLVQKIHGAIRKSDALIAIITKDNPSQSVGEEISFAKSINLEVIPFVEDGASVGFTLGHVEQMRFKKDKLGAACDRVARYVTEELFEENETQHDQKEDDEVLVDERKAVDEYEYYGYNFEEGDVITGKISSDIPIDVYIVDKKNLERLFENEDFHFELESEQVTRYSLNFVVPKTRVWNIVIQNASRELANVDVKIVLNAI